MTEGFIKIERAMLEHPLLQDGERFRAWVWLLCKACWKPRRYDVGGRIITLERGQLSTSIRTLASEWGWSKSAVSRFLARLESETMIGTDAGTGRLLITVRNYANYQGEASEAGTATGTATGTAAGQQRDIKEEVKKLETPNGVSPKRASARAVQLPGDWEPVLTPTAARTVERWPDGMFAEQLEQFRDHAADKGRTSKDWQAAFRTWIKNADKWRRENGQRGQRGGAGPGGGGDGVSRALNAELGLGEFAGGAE